MTDEQLAEIKARAEAATPEPWKWQPFDSIIATSVGVHVVRGNGTGVVSDEDAVFIAHARSDIPALLAEVEAWREIGRAVADEDFYDGSYRCRWCGLSYTLRHDGYTHADDCPIIQARALLGEQERKDSRDE